MPNAEGVRLEKFQSNPIDWGSRHGGVTAPGTQMNQLGLRGEIMQGVIHLKPLQHDPSRGLGGPSGPYCR